MATVAEIQDLKDEVEALKVKKARLQGQISEMKKEKRYSSLEELKKLIVAYQNRKEAAEQHFQTLLAEYKTFYEEHVQ